MSAASWKSVSSGLWTLANENSRSRWTHTPSTGKGRHPAALNMGDCYAYACAKANRAALLFKGEDFTKTDITQAR